MVSSGDEFESYQQPHSSLVKPREHNASAGPSSKRSKVSEPSEPNKTTATDPITISSSDEQPPPKVRRGRGTTFATSNGRAAASRGKGKSAATRTKNELASVEDVIVDTDDDVGTSLRAPRRIPAGVTIKTNERLQEQLTYLRKEYEDVVQQRDRLSSQLGQIFQLRETQMEKLLTDQKSQYEMRFKVQEDTIHELQKSLSRIDALSKAGSTTSLHFLTRETADEEKQEVQREVTRLKKALRDKDSIITQKEAVNEELRLKHRILEDDLKAEIDRNKDLSSKNVTSGKHSPKKTDPKHSLTVQLYEELTGILITNIRHEPGHYKDDDAIYTCVQTTSTNKSLIFTLKFFQEEAQEGEIPTNTRNNLRLVDKVVFTPMELERESNEFIEQLDIFAQPFTFQKSQMSVFTKALTSHLEGDNGDQQSDISQMDVENDE